MTSDSTATAQRRIPCACRTARSERLPYFVQSVDRGPGRARQIRIPMGVQFLDQPRRRWAASSRRPAASPRATAGTAPIPFLFIDVGGFRLAALRLGPLFGSTRRVPGISEDSACWSYDRPFQKLSLTIGT